MGFFTINNWQELKSLQKLKVFYSILQLLFVLIVSRFFFHCNINRKMDEQCKLPIAAKRKKGILYACDFSIMTSRICSTNCSLISIHSNNFIPTLSFPNCFICQIFEYVLTVPYSLVETVLVYSNNSSLKIAQSRVLFWLFSPIMSTRAQQILNQREVKSATQKGKAASRHEKANQGTHSFLGTQLHHLQNLPVKGFILQISSHKMLNIVVS